MPDIKDVLIANANAIAVGESVLPLGQSIIGTSLAAFAQGLPAMPSLPGVKELGAFGGGFPFPMPFGLQTVTPPIVTGNAPTRSRPLAPATYTI